MKSISNIGILVFSMAILLAACNSAPEAEAAGQEVPVVVEDFAVTAQGRLVPVRHVQLGFGTGGEITEVLVNAGEQVQAGDLLARLKFVDNREALEASVAAAELELLSSRQDLADLFDNYPIQAASAQFDLVQAQDALEDAEYKWQVQQEGNRASGDTINAAQANLILAEEEVERAEKAFNRVSGRRDDDPVRALALSNLSAARQKRDQVLRQLNWLTGKPTDLDQALLDAEVALAQAQMEETQRQWEILATGPDPDQVALLEERIQTAEARLKAAEAAVADLEDQIPELRAPIAGTVVRVDLKAGENAIPGQPAVILADFSQWTVETDDLTEIEVVDVSVGQPVTIVPDSLPDVKLTGVVQSIGDLFEEKRGDITYTADILVDEIDPRLRWGMTVVVTFPAP